MSRTRRIDVSDLHEVLAAIGELDDDEIDLADAALQLARVDAPEADWQAARAHLSELARDAVALAGEIGADDVAGQVRGLAELLSGRHGYAGDSKDYDDLANANLIRVIERRRGLPVALGVLWLHAAQAAGWAAHGVNFPNHFLLAFGEPGRMVVADVFAGGRMLDLRELKTLLKKIEGPRAELNAALLRPMTARDVLLRLQNNIKLRRLAAKDSERALACLEDMLLIAPDEAALWRECATVNQALDRVAAAVTCLERFLALVPRGQAATRARVAMAELRTRLN